MKKGKLLYFCYCPVLLGLIFSKEIGLSQFAIGFGSFIIGICILIFQVDIADFRRLYKHLFWGTMIGYILAGILNLTIGSNDVVSQAAIIVFIVVGAILFSIQYVIEYILSKMLKRNRKQ